MPRLWQPIIIDGARIVELRGVLRSHYYPLRQVDLAEHIGVNEKTIRRWEAGGAKISEYSSPLKKLRALAKSKKFNLKEKQADGYG